VDQCSYSWLGVNQLGHDLAHDGSSDDKHTVYRWYSEQFAYLLESLDAVPEGEGTLLDNTVVLWVSEFGNSAEHSPDDLLWLLMGNVGGFFRQGQVLELGGRSSNDVHTTIARAFGLELDSFGNPAYGDGAIDALRA
jgi:hypothetical protein